MPNIAPLFTSTSDRIEVLLNCAGLLFAQHGFHAVGVDRIIAESGVAKMTLYRHFPTKNHLIIGVLEKRRSEIDALLRLTTEPKTSKIEKVREIFEWFDACVKSETFHGCIFTRAASEFYTEDREIVETAKLQKLDMYRMLAEIVGEKPSLVRNIISLIDGSITQAIYYDDRAAVRDAMDAATELIKIDLSKPAL